MQRFVELPLGAQTAYAELLDQAQSLEMQRQIGHLTGSFHKKVIKGRAYWYFAYRDLDAKHHMVYVGPDNVRVQTLVERFRHEKPVPLGRQAKSAIALGSGLNRPRICSRLPAWHPTFLSISLPILPRPGPMLSAAVQAGENVQPRVGRRCSSWRRN